MGWRGDYPFGRRDDARGHAVEPSPLNLARLIPGDTQRPEFRYSMIDANLYLVEDVRSYLWAGFFLG